MGLNNLTVGDVSPAAIKDAVLRSLEKYDRRPFIKQLAALVGCAPSLTALQAFADKHPDRWAQAVSIMAGLAGFKKDDVTINVFNVRDLSDAELLARAAKLGIKLPATVEGQAIAVADHG